MCWLPYTKSKGRENTSLQQQNNTRTTTYRKKLQQKKYAEDRKH